MLSSPLVRDTAWVVPGIFSKDEPRPILIDCILRAKEGMLSADSVQRRPTHLSALY